MVMYYCRACGKEVRETKFICDNCDTSQELNMKNNESGTIPDGIKGWSWGAFFLNWIWAIGNRTWWGLLALLPYVGFIMAIILGIKGREWAWKNNKWENIEHFNNVQKKWSFWGVLIAAVIMCVGILAAIAIPAYNGYLEHAKQEITATTPVLLSSLPEQNCPETEGANVVKNGKKLTDCAPHQLPVCKGLFDDVLKGDCRYVAPTK